MTESPAARALGIPFTATTPLPVPPPTDACGCACEAARDEEPDDDEGDEEDCGEDCECGWEDEEICSTCHEEFCECPSPEMVEYGLEKIYRVDMALQYCDDPEIRNLLEQALPLLYQAQALNEARMGKASPA